MSNGKSGDILTRLYEDRVIVVLQGNSKLMRDEDEGKAMTSNSRRQNPRQCGVVAVQLHSF